MMPDIRVIIKHMLVKSMWIFPINERRVVFWDFKGKSYGGNSRAVSDYLKKYSKIEKIWILDDAEKFHSGIGIKFVKTKSLLAYFYIATAKVWVETHNFFPDQIPKRKHQIAIQTWHGALPIKTIEGFKSQFFSQKQIENMKKSSKITDYLLSGGTLSTNILRKGMFYDGEVLEFGSPRCDIIINQDTDLEKEKIYQLYKRYNIPSNINKFVLYVPTYRDDDGIINQNFDPKQICNSLTERFGGNWCCLFRPHPLSEKIAINDYCIDVSDYECVEELMLIADVCISDYSSIIMDYMFTLKPCFLYCFDLPEYNKTRGFCLQIEDLPFENGANIESLTYNILNYDVEKGRNKILDYCAQNGLIADGKASERLGEFIRKLLEGGKKY